MCVCVCVQEFISKGSKLYIYFIFVAHLSPSYNPFLFFYIDRNLNYFFPEKWHCVATTKMFNDCSSFCVRLKTF